MKKEPESAPAISVKTWWWRALIFPPASGNLAARGDVLLEITQIGKECHSHCAIYHKMGDCIMPREGVFARVLEAGQISIGDQMSVFPRKEPLPFQAAVITLSDRCSSGEREDESGPAIEKRLIEEGYQIIERLVLPDDPGRPWKKS